MITQLHEKLVKQFIIDRVRSGLPIDQAAVSTLDLALPFIWKRTGRFCGVSGILISRDISLFSRLIAARAAMEDVFLSPEYREYYAEGNVWGPNGHRTRWASIEYIDGDQGRDSFDCLLDVRYTLVPDFPRRITFTNVDDDPEQRELYTGNFNSLSETSTDEWLDPRFFTFTGAK